jgi:hypothetical protein
VHQPAADGGLEFDLKSGKMQLRIAGMARCSKLDEKGEKSFHTSAPI